MRLLDLTENSVETSAELFNLGDGRGARVVTLAPWQLWLASVRSDYAAAIRSADVTTIDGKWLAVILRIAGRRRALLTGRALVESVYNRSEVEAETVAVIGGSEESHDRLRELKPEWTLVGGDFDEQPSEGSLRVTAELLGGSSVVFLALGSPKQEFWSRELLRIHPATYIGIGGAVETVVGIRRAPGPTVQTLKLEWFQRLAQDPRRFLPRVLQAFSVLPRLTVEALVERVRRRRAL